MIDVYSVRKHTELEKTQDKACGTWTRNSWSWSLKWRERKKFNVDKHVQHACRRRNNLPVCYVDVLDIYQIIYRFLNVRSSFTLKFKKELLQVGPMYCTFKAIIFQNYEEKSSKYKRYWTVNNILEVYVYLNVYKYAF